MIVFGVILALIGIAVAVFAHRVVGLCVFLVGLVAVVYGLTAGGSLTL